MSGIKTRSTSQKATGVNLWCGGLPNTDSFVLRRGPIVKPSFTPLEVAVPRPVPQLAEGDGSGSSGLTPKARARLLTGFTPEARRGVFLPTTDSFSFVLTRGTIVEPSFAPMPVLEETGVGTQSVESTDSEQPKVKDQGKRTFLKVASIAGASAIASQILSPKKASAFIMGSSPTTGVVGVKNAANTRINPATEETVSTLATQATAATLLKTSDLSLNAGVLDVKVTSGSFSDSGSVAKSGLVDADRHVQVDVLSSALPTSASTEDTLETISFGGVKFALRLATDSGNGAIDYVGEAAIGTAPSAAAWRIKKVDSTSGVVIKWADGSGSFTKIWDNRESLTYS